VGPPPGQASQGQETQKTAKRNGIIWATNLASTMLNEWLALWKLRNEDMHVRDKTAQIRARTVQIRREVELLYEQADQGPEPNYIDHTIYRHDLETQLEKTTAELIGWLSNWAPVVHQHQQLLKQQQLQLQQQQQQQQLQQQQQQQEQQEPQQDLQQAPQPQSQQQSQQSQQSQASTNTMHSATGV
jgi:hypothetical protein